MRDETSEAAQPTFRMETWLTERAEKPDLVVVELGHGIRPLAQVQDFHKGRAYIGVEAGINTFHYGPRAAQNITRLLADKAGQNIFLVNQPIDTKQRGEEDDQTILPDSSADEVFLRNVIGDPGLGSVEEATKIIREAGRLVTAEGKVIISENNTPYDPAKVREIAEAAGFVVDTEIHPDQSGWDTLQELYVTKANRNHWDDYSPRSYYMVLSKTQPSQESSQIAA